MRANPDTRIGAADDWVKRLAPAVPYVAVLVGLHALSSAWASIILYHAGIVGVVALRGSWARPQVPNRTSCRPLLVAYVLGAALTGPIVYASWSMIRLGDSSLTATLAGLGLSGGAWALFTGYYAVVNPFLEEVFWRRYLGSEGRSVVVNDVLFAGYHILVLVDFVEVPWVVVAFGALIAAGWLWRLIAGECGGLLIPLVSHAAADASLIIAVAALAG